MAGNVAAAPATKVSEGFNQMKIARIDVFGYDLHYVHGSYIMSGGRVVTALPSTVVRLTTDGGLIAVPLGPAEEMAAYVRTRRAEGIHRFQLKVGGDPHADRDRVERVLEATDDTDIIVADANGGWTLQDAIVAARLLTPLPRVYLEQPCPTLEEYLYVRRHTTLPMVLDEVITDVQSFLRAARAGGMEAISLKIGKVGGLAKAKLMRDLAESPGIRVTVEDMWGGDIVTAAISHLAGSTRPGMLFTVSFMNDWVREHVAGHEPRSDAGFGMTPDAPGLGIEVDTRTLGGRLFSVPE